MLISDNNSYNIQRMYMKGQMSYSMPLHVRNMDRLRINMCMNGEDGYKSPLVQQYSYR